MTKEEVVEKVFKLITDQLGIPRTDNFGNQDLIADLNVDSLDTIELTMEIESAFDIEVSDQEAEMLVTPNLIADCVFRKLN